MEDQVVKNIAFLRQKSVDVTSVEEAKELISKLEDTLRPISHGVGLAAIQIGIPKKIGVIKSFRRKGDPDFIHLINPVVISKEEEFVYFNEGCLSFPDTFRNTKRYKAFTIKHQRITEENKFEEQTLYFYYDDDPSVPSDGIIAIAVQHEMDHFGGELIIDSKADMSLKPIPIVADKKIGRNEPCPCGSGKKYKKCCLNN